VQRLASLLAWLLLFAVALLTRALRFGLVLTPSGVRFPHGADELYHLRRIWFTVVNFPASLSFDRYMNHPEGAPPIWPPLFDWSIAAVARALVGPEDQHAVEVVAAFAPPVIGAFAVLAAAWLGRRTFSPAAGWLTGLWLALLPAHVFYGMLGEVDHHVAVGLFGTVLVACAMRLAGPLRPGGGPSGALVTGAAAAASLLLWPGSLLQVLVLQTALVLQLLLTRQQASARARALGLAQMHALATLLLLPFCAGKSWDQLGSISPLVLSTFQPLWLGAGAAALGGVALLWSRQALGASRLRRLASALGLGALGLALAWLALPGLAEALAGAVGWFEADPFLGEISELQPLLYVEGPFDVTLAHDQFSYLFWLYPFAALGLALYALQSRRAELWPLLAWSAAFCAATLFQQRFTDASAAGFALVLAPAAVLGVRAARERLRVPRAACAGIVLLLTLLALGPYAPAYRDDLEVSLAARRGARLHFDAEVRHRLVLERAGSWLKQNTPATAGYLDAAARPEFGVLSAWGHGHLLRYYAERPLVEDNFGPWGGTHGFERARAYYASGDEEEAYRIAAELGARYVVAAPQGSGQSWPRRGSLALRLALRQDRAGTLTFGDGGANALSRHRLVFVADDADLARGGEPPWTLGIYEIVPGARVVGLAPGARVVTFELLLPLPGRNPLRYQASASVDAAGRYEIRLPHFGTAGYVVQADSQVGALTLAEADVLLGRDVVGPSFAPRAGLPTPP